MAKHANFELAEKVYDTLKKLSISDSGNEWNAGELADSIILNPKYRESCQEKLNLSENPFLQGRNIDEASSDLVDQVKREIRAKQNQIRKKYPEIKINKEVKPHVFYL